MFAVCVIALLCLVPASQSAPPACEHLLQALDQVDPRHLAGKWALVAGSVSDSAHLEKFQSRDSASINFGNASETSETTLTRVFNVNGTCHYLSSNVTLTGSGFRFRDFNITVSFLRSSCPDCAVMRFDDESKPLRVYLFSRRREVEQTELEEFKAQAECLQMLPAVVKDPKKELCPSGEEEPEAAGA